MNPVYHTSIFSRHNVGVSRRSHEMQELSESVRDEDRHNLGKRQASGYGGLA